MKVLVIGDIIIDKYIYGTSTRLSPEAPVPVVTQERTEETIGGAGLVHANLLSLGVDSVLFNAEEEPKSLKTRVICDGHYITRIDNDVHTDGEDVLRRVREIDFSAYEYVIMSDYDKGYLDESVQLIEHFNKFGCKVIVDPKTHANRYEGAWLVKPNEKEFQEYFINWQGNIITTRASDSVIAKIDNEVYEVDVERVEVSDVTGAGDCFLAGFVYALVNGYDYERAIKLAVQGSTESVKHVGTYILTEKDLKKKVVFTNGCFDVLHKGHLTLLKQARSLGDKLIVGLNSDASVQRLKGATRPFNDIDTRREQLLLIPYVDDVIIFEEDTPYELIKEIKPDLIVKGGDYTVEEIVGHDLAPVHIVPTVEGYSTTKILEANE